MRDPSDILINGRQLSDILESHKLWLMDKGGERADLSSANLYSADLSSADLRSANLYNANLRSADLSSADLRSANLRSANLRSADLSSADLRSANLYNADLRSANLRSANLRSANLSSANLRSANLRSANLYNADLSSADLSSADLRSAKNAEQADAITRILPDGDLIVWKKARTKTGAPAIVMLKIPAAAKRSNATGRKCRAEYAKDLKHFVDGKETKQKLYSDHDSSFVYEVGKIIRPDGFDENRWEECSTGVHFFITRWEAENY